MATVAGSVGKYSLMDLTAGGCGHWTHFGSHCWFEHIVGLTVGVLPEAMEIVYIANY